MNGFDFINAGKIFSFAFTLGIALFSTILTHYCFNKYKIDVILRGEQYKMFSIIQKRYQNEIMDQNNIVDPKERVKWEKALNLIVLEKIDQSTSFPIVT